MSHLDWDQQEYMDGWVQGWARARGTSPPRPIEGGWSIQVDAPGEFQRFVLNPVRQARLAELVAGDVPLDTCIKFAGQVEEWHRCFPPGWEFSGPTWMMLRQLPSSMTAAVQPGYEVSTEVESDVVHVAIHAADGSIAASGRAGLGPSYVVPDQIVTAQAHRRRGLGSRMMAELEVIALECGRQRAVLGATSDGRALYERLGWSVGGGLVGVTYRASQ